MENTGPEDSSDDMRPGRNRFRYAYNDAHALKLREKKTEDLRREKAEIRQKEKADSSNRKALRKNTT